MVSGTGSQSHTKWAGWLTLTLSVVTHCSSSAINISTWLLLAIVFWKCSYWWQWHGAWKLLSQFVSRWPTVTVTLKISSLSLVAFSISIGIYQPHDVLQLLCGPLQLHHWLDTNQHQHMALVGNFILKMFLLMTMTWSLKIALTICVKMTYSDSDTKNLQPQSCGIFNIYWYLSATWCTTTTTWTTTTTLAGYKYFNIKSARHIY